MTSVTPNLELQCTRIVIFNKPRNLLEFSIGELKYVFVPEGAPFKTNIINDLPGEPKHW